MKKSTLIGVIIAILVVSVVGGYYFANQYAKKVAEKRIDTLLEKNHLKKDVSYKNLTSSILSRSITIHNLIWNVNKNGKKLGKIVVDELVIHGNPLSNDYSVVIKNANIINLQKINPDLSNKTIATIKTGHIEVEKEDAKEEEKINLTDIHINKNIFFTTQSDFEKITKILNLNAPINIKAHLILDKKDKTAFLDHYTINWKDNLAVSYSLKLANVDIEGFREIAKQLNGDNPNPIMVLGLLSKAYEIKPLEVKVKFKNYGAVDRFIQLISKTEHTSKEDIIKRLQFQLNHSPFKKFSQPIVSFVDEKKKHLEITIDNPEQLSVGDLGSRLTSNNFYKILHIEVE
ncbi:YdgA family protein [Hippea jasoniae]|uniref:hypothetical protein n=1 Tax=Hippea jasoniae TaxID=944479 RepID=UPI0005585847|nr:hypothetical protein [Hippea jasoniae]